MALSILRNGTPLDQLYGTKGASTAAATGCLQNGVDINQYLLALADGKALGFNSGLSKNGMDFSAIFGVPTGNTPLPINGQKFSSGAQSGTGGSSASTRFSANTAGWAINTTSTPSGSAQPASGTLPIGATTMLITTSNTIKNGTSNTLTNQAGSTVPLTSTAQGCLVSSSATPSNESDITTTLTITFYNSAGTSISATEITISSTATGSA